MAYTDTGHTHKKLAGGTGVALVHIALAFGLAAGLTITYVAPPEDPGLKGGTVYVQLPPPPPPVDRVEPDDTVTPQPVDQYIPPASPPVDFDFKRSDPVQLADLDIPIRPLDRVGTDMLGSGNITDPVQPIYRPTDPVPTNGPQGWVSTNDYPRRALTRGWEGDLTYALDVGANGGVQRCRITSSTGYDILDRTTCDVIERRARFEPATDSSGNAVFGTFRGKVSWLIPED